MTWSTRRSQSAAAIEWRIRPQLSGLGQALGTGELGNARVRLGVEPTQDRESYMRSVAVSVWARTYVPVASTTSTGSRSMKRERGGGGGF
eukprot:COSAG02_NODE_5531_length_4252_cov_2.279316_6_plen_89_part_01